MRVVGRFAKDVSIGTLGGIASQSVPDLVRRGTRCNLGSYSELAACFPDGVPAHSHPTDPVRGQSVTHRKPTTSRLMSESTHDNPDQAFFRCPVQDEDSAATILIRGRKIPVTLQDRSIDGFSVLIDPRYVRKLRVGPRWILKSGGEITEVWAQWMFNAPDGRVQLGLRRLRDLTPQPKASWFPTINSYQKHTQNPELLLAGIVLASFLTLSLPGIGDHLGTSGKIQAGLRVICEVIGESIREVW